MAFEVGDGKRVKFWEDTWCGERMLKNEFADMYGLAIDPKLLVADYMSLMGGVIVWNLTLRRNLFDWEILRVIELLSPLQAMHINMFQDDRRMWKVASRGEFSVRSC